MVSRLLHPDGDDILTTGVALRLGPDLRPMLQDIKRNLRAKRHTAPGAVRRLQAAAIPSSPATPYRPWPAPPAGRHALDARLPACGCSPALQLQQHRQRARTGRARRHPAPAHRRLVRQRCASPDRLRRRVGPPPASDGPAVRVARWQRSWPGPALGTRRWLCSSPPAWRSGPSMPEAEISCAKLARWSRPARRPAR